jgi:hypothetical protein
LFFFTSPLRGGVLLQIPATKGASLDTEKLVNLRSPDAYSFTNDLGFVVEIRLFSWA